jgi:hypothetical protein
MEFLVVWHGLYAKTNVVILIDSVFGGAFRMSSSIVNIS